VENKMYPRDDGKRQRHEISAEDQSVMRAGGVVHYRKTGDGRLIRTVEPAGRRRTATSQQRPVDRPMTAAEAEKMSADLRAFTADIDRKLAEADRLRNLRRQAARFSR
jgi:hypothetical protein